MNTSTIQRAALPTTTAAAAAPRMSLANVRKGRIDVPLRVVIFGPEGVGKSTFAAGAPNPIFLGADNGTARLDIARLPEPREWSDVLEGCDLLVREQHTYKTLVIDPVNWLEPLVHRAVVGDSGKSLEDWGGGYGRGQAAALDHWRQLVAALERVWRNGLNVVITSHQTVKKFEDPTGPAYERYEMAIAQKAAGLLRQWVDFVLFAKHEAYGKLDTTTKRVKGFGTGARLIHTQWSAAYDAKAREKIPEELPLSWAAFDDAVKSASLRKGELMQQIDAALAELADASTTKTVREYLATVTDTDRIAEVANALAQKIGEKQ